MKQTCMSILAFAVLWFATYQDIDAAQTPPSGRGIPKPLPAHPGNVFIEGEEVVVPLPKSDARWNLVNYEGQALGEFTGVGRRFQRYGDVALAGGGSYTVVDDYGHHPAEMAATIAAARGAFPGRRLLLAFQPHRFTRTRDLFEDFVRVLSTVDELVLADVYPAGEAPIVGADGRSLARSVRLAGKVEPLFVETTAEMRDAVLSRVRDGDVVMTMGAGSIANLAPELAIPSVGRRAQ